MKTNTTKRNINANFEAALRGELLMLGVKNDEVIANTPRRFSKFLEEYTTSLRKRYDDYKVFTSDYNQMVTVETSFYSLCEHHLVPYFGKAFVSYLPKKDVVGVSKIVKLVKHQFKKPSIQEAVTEQIADCIKDNMDTAGVAVVVKGFHLCVAMRYGEGWMTTSSMHGVFKLSEPTRNEFLAFIQPRLNEFKL